MKGQIPFLWNIPIRYVYLDDGTGYEERYISDLYYADVFRYNNETGYSFDDWDSNNNNVFGEWNKENKDVLDLFPDVYVGRIPCRTIFNARNLVDKLINYETKKKTWFKKYFSCWRKYN